MKRIDVVITNRWFVSLGCVSKVRFNRAKDDGLEAVIGNKQMEPM